MPTKEVSVRHKKRKGKNSERPSSKGEQRWRKHVNSNWMSLYYSFIVTFSWSSCSAKEWLLNFLCHRTYTIHHPWGRPELKQTEFNYTGSGRMFFIRIAPRGKSIVISNYIAFHFFSRTFTFLMALQMRLIVCTRHYALLILTDNLVSKTMKHDEMHWNKLARNCWWRVLPLWIAPYSLNKRRTSVCSQPTGIVIQFCHKLNKTVLYYSCTWHAKPLFLLLPYL